tara:strand:- start:107 stop:1186 length:1080 start_codon:yes stop_codon:yes gene_type:complete
MKILFLVPHLSTGGMPQFLLKRIQALKAYTNYEIFVYEWMQLSVDYDVQRKQIQSLIPNRNFISCGKYPEPDVEIQKNIINYLIENEIDIVHVEDIIEDFMDVAIQEKLYDLNHPWKIIETPHSLNYNPNYKKYEPSGYCFTTEHHYKNTIKDKSIKLELIKYPLDTSVISFKSRNKILGDIGWRTNGEYHIVNVGLWTPNKNQGYAIELAKTLWDKYGWTYIFHFIGNQAENFEDYWKPLMDDLPPNIRIHGEQDTDVVSEYLKMSDVMLFTSIWESWGIVLEEAVANKLKILAYDFDHYEGERTPFIEVLSGDINKDYELLLNTIHSPIKYSDDELSTKLNMKEFANKHIKLYKAIA